MAVATHNGWVTDSREMESEGEREIHGGGATRRGFCQGLSLGSAAGSMAPCQCHYVGVCSGAVSAQTDVTHTF